MACVCVCGAGLPTSREKYEHSMSLSVSEYIKPRLPCNASPSSAHLETKPARRGWLGLALAALARPSRAAAQLWDEMARPMRCGGSGRADWVCLFVRAGGTATEPFSQCSQAAAPRRRESGARALRHGGARPPRAATEAAIGIPYGRPGESQRRTSAGRIPRPRGQRARRGRTRLWGRPTCTGATCSRTMDHAVARCNNVQRHDATCPVARRCNQNATVTIADPRRRVNGTARAREDRDSAAGQLRISSRRVAAAMRTM